MSPRNYQPAREVMYSQRWSAVMLAEEIGISYSHLRCALMGTSAPSPKLRERMPEILGVPLEKLFTADLLAKEYQGPRNQYARRPRAAS